MTFPNLRRCEPSLLIDFGFKLMVRGHFPWSRGYEKSLYRKRSQPCPFDVLLKLLESSRSLIHEFFYLLLS